MLGKKGTVVGQAEIATSVAVVANAVVVEVEIEEHGHDWRNSSSNREPSFFF